MPSEKSARVAMRKAKYNRGMKSAANTAVASMRRAIAASDGEQASAASQKAAVALDRAAKGGAIHRNNASRRTARLARQLRTSRQ